MMKKIITLSFLLFFITSAFSQSYDYDRALRRIYYLLNGKLPTQTDFDKFGNNLDGFQKAVRNLMNQPEFYDAVLRYHERLLGVGLSSTYLDEFQKDYDPNNNRKRISSLTCSRTSNNIFRCYRTSTRKPDCPSAKEVSVSAFWYPGLEVRVCPSILTSCGTKMEKCFVQYTNQKEGANTEVGQSEIFDSRVAIIKSLSLQPAGIATGVVMENYPYTKILEPGLTAVNGVLAYFFQQSHLFNIDALKLPYSLKSQLENISPTETRFKLIYTGQKYTSAGIISTYGWLRRYEKNRTRANQTYERILCRKLSSELPRVFPQDPGNLRTTPGCSGCHATLDPLADFYSMFGEQAELYRDYKKTNIGEFVSKSGYTLSDLANIIRNDEAFAQCAVNNVWSWLIGRPFHRSEENLRKALSDYFISTSYSFRELVYAVSTHPTFALSARSDGIVADPLDQPALGKVAEPTLTDCTQSSYTYSQHIAPFISQCSSCHYAGSSRNSKLDNYNNWKTYGATALTMISSGNMPPGQVGPPAPGTSMYNFKENIRCWLSQGANP